MTSATPSAPTPPNWLSSFKHESPPSPTPTDTHTYTYTIKLKPTAGATQERTVTVQFKEKANLSPAALATRELGHLLLLKSMRRLDKDLQGPTDLFKVRSVIELVTDKPKLIDSTEATVAIQEPAAASATPAKVIYQPPSTPGHLQPEPYESSKTYKGRELTAQTPKTETVLERLERIRREHLHFHSDIDVFAEHKQPPGTVQGTIVPTPVATAAAPAAAPAAAAAAPPPAPMPAPAPTPPLQAQPRLAVDLSPAAEAAPTSELLALPAPPGPPPGTPP